MKAITIQLPDVVEQALTEFAVSLGLPASAIAARIIAHEVCHPEEKALACKQAVDANVGGFHSDLLASVQSRGNEWKRAMERELSAERKEYAHGAWRVCLAIADELGASKGDA